MTVTTDVALPTGGEAARRGDGWPLVTVAMVAYNRRDAVRVALGKVVRELDYPALEVIVADNASSDGTVEMVRREFPSVRVLASPANVGAPAWNPIFRMARGAWVLILDDDAYLEGPDLRRAVAAAEANAADLVSFRVRSSVTPGFYFSEEDPAGLLSFWGCSALISRRALQELGGYDPGIFIWGNEVELTTRFLNRGLRHLYLHDVVSTHMKGRSPTTPFPARWHAMTHRHWAYGVAKNLQPLDAARILGRLLGKVALHSVARSPRAAWTLPAVLAGSVHGLRARGVPVRPEVSAVYRAHYQSYATPLAVVGRRLDRLRGRGLRYYVQRAEYYPQRNALIEL